MEPPRIAELLKSYTVGLDLPSGIFERLSVYLDLLLRWNAKTNLTAIRDPEQIVIRHFGESLFAAGVLSEAKELGEGIPDHRQLTSKIFSTLADLGSGAGFPGIPIKLAFPSSEVTLIESQNKKATFLKEVIRALGLKGIQVYSGRAEQWGKQADVVTLRAVEKFESILPVAARLVAPGGHLCLLIGSSQKGKLTDPTGFTTEVEIALPNRSDSMVVVGKLRVLDNPVGK